MLKGETWAKGATDKSWPGIGAKVWNKPYTGELWGRELADHSSDNTSLLTPWLSWMWICWYKEEPSKYQGNHPVIAYIYCLHSDCRVFIFLKDKVVSWAACMWNFTALHNVYECLQM